MFWAASLLGTAVVTAYALSRGAGALHAADLLLLASVVVAAVGYAEGGRLTRELPGWQVVGWGLVIAFPISLAPHRGRDREQRAAWSEPATR